MNYHEVAQINRHKTYIVLSIYLLIYVGLGLLIDIILMNDGDFTSSLIRLINLEVIPIATLSMLAIAVVSIIISILMFSRIQLSGQDYIEITKDNDHGYKRLYNIVEELKIAGSMDYMPKVYIMKANYMNAFASGWSEKNTMVAITDGLYNKLNYAELTAVMAHEMTHIRNQDIKLTLVVGIVTNLMLFVVDWLTFFMLKGSNSEGARKARMILLVLHFILPILTIVLQMWLSRSREYMADAGAVELSRDPIAMANALRKISNDYENNNYKEDSNTTRKAAYIFQKGDSIFSTHPTIKNRINKILGKD